MGSMWVSCGFKGFPRVWEMAAVGQKEFLGDFKGLQDISERYRVHGFSGALREASKKDHVI